MEIAIVGAGIGGLTLALALQRAGIAVRIYEAVPEIRPLGVGINILPHASHELALLGLEPALSRVCVLTREAVVLQPVRPARSIASRSAAMRATPIRSTRSIAARCIECCSMRSSRGSAPTACLPAVRCMRLRAGCAGVVAHFATRARASGTPATRADALVACDGLHSVDPQGAPSGRRRAALFRRQHVARRFGVAADPDRREHDSRRLARDRQDGHLSDSRRRR